MKTNDNSTPSLQSNVEVSITEVTPDQLYFMSTSSPRNTRATRLRTRKTPLKSRISYPYVFATGEIITLYPSRDGETNIYIKSLHALDDAEIYNNLKHAHSSFTTEQKAQMAQWHREHPSEVEPDLWRKWNVPFDAAFADDGGSFDKSQIAYRAWASTQEPEQSPLVEKVFDFVATLSAHQQKLFDLAFVKELPQTDIAVILGIKPSAVSRAIKRLREAIRNNCK